MTKTTELNGVSVKSVEYLNTSRGVAFTASLFLDNQKIGFIENSGTGGPTSVFIEIKEAREEFSIRMKEYFKNLNDEPVEEESTFADHLLDVHDFGKVLSDEEKLQLLLENE